MLRYDISPLDPEAHLFIVGITVARPTPEAQFFRLPNWIAGSYMIRDFAACVQSEKAFLGDKEVPVVKVDKCTWRVSTAGCADGESLRFFYQLWAQDASVRGNYLDNCRGFFNPGAAFMEALGIDVSEGILVNITPPDDDLHASSLAWKVGTSLTRAADTERFGWGLYRAAGYRELWDSPVELSDFTALTFEAGGARHDIIINDTNANFDAARLLEDVRTICEAQCRFFDPLHGRCPVGEYTFLLNVTASSFGGLEHASSTALACPRKTLPSTHDLKRTKNYQTLLGLFSHEYFHTWFVKRIKPAEFVDCAFDMEVTTRLLWLFEGATSYYDNFMLRRTGLVNDEEYAALLTEDFKYVLGNAAHRAQTLSEASFDAWIKYYKPTANTPNAHVSYYRQGALAALVLNAEILRKTKGEKSLDDVMRLFWRDFLEAGDDYGGVGEEDVSDVILRATGLDLTDLLTELTQSTAEIDYAAALKPLGITLGKTELPAVRALLGLTGRTTEAGFVVKTVHEGEAGQWIGIAPGDVLIAVDGVRIRPETFEDILARYGAGDEMLIHAFRDDALMAWSLLLGKEKTLSATAAIKPVKLTRAWIEGTAANEALDEARETAPEAAPDTAPKAAPQKGKKRAKA